MINQPFAKLNEPKADKNKETANLKEDVKDLKTLCNRMLEAMTDNEVITAAMLEDWGQEVYHIENRI